MAKMNRAHNGIVIPLDIF